MNIQPSVHGRQDSEWDVVPPSSSCRCHSSSQMDFSQPSADTPLLLSLALVGRTIVFGVTNSLRKCKRWALP